MIDLGTLGYVAPVPIPTAAVSAVFRAASTTAGKSLVLRRGPTVSSGSLWDDGAMIHLGTLPGGTYSAASAVNDHRQSVGRGDTAFGETHAVFWQDGTMTDLGTLGGAFGSGAV